MDYETTDKYALRCATAAMQSQEAPLTIEEAAKALGFAMPRTDFDLTELSRTCERWGIRTNVDTEPFWLAALEGK